MKARKIILHSPEYRRILRSLRAVYPDVESVSRLYIKSRQVIAAQWKDSRGQPRTTLDHLADEIILITHQ